MELYLYAACQPAAEPILSSIFLNAHFTNDANSISEIHGVEFSIYPNPNNGEFTLNLTPSNEQTNLLIYNASGQVVQQNRIAEGTTSLQLTNATLSPGLYLVEIRSENDRTSKRMIVR